MEGLYGAALGLVAWWRIYKPPVLPLKEKQMSLPWPKTMREKVGGAVNVTIVLAMLGIMMLMIYFTSTQFDQPGDYIMYSLKVFARATTFPFIFLSPLVLLAMIVIVTNFESWLPKLNIAIPDLWKKRGSERLNTVLIPTRNPYFGLSYTLILLLMAPTFASYEEFFFRDKNLNEQWLVIGPFVERTPELVFVLVWSVLAFGLIHLFSGVTVSEALVLGFVGGMYFAVVYRYFGGLPAAIVAHTSYNIWAIGFMVSPDFRALVSRMLRYSGDSINPNN